MDDPKSKYDSEDDPIYAPEAGCEYLRTWEEGDFKLIMWDTNRMDSYHKCVLAYEFYHKGNLVFQGADFHWPLTHAVDSDKAVGGILHFLALRPGDTDEEYFEDYTPAQMEFAQSHGEELWSLAHDLEEKEEE